MDNKKKNLIYTCYLTVLRGKGQKIIANELVSVSYKRLIKV